MKFKTAHTHASMAKQAIVALTLFIAPVALSAQELSRTSPVQPINSSLAVKGLVYSSTAIEIFWPASANPTVKYEVYRNGALVKELSNGLSHFDDGLKPNTGYTYCVYAFAEMALVNTGQLTKFTADDGSGSDPLPVNGSCPGNPIQPVSPALSADVYSATAVEIFWSRDNNSETTYNLFRDGLLMTENSTGTSYFESNLNANTRYTYCLYSILNNEVTDREAITVTTLDNGSGVEPMPAAGTCPSNPLGNEVVPVKPIEIGPLDLRGVVYSETAVEIFWNRVPSPDVMYRVYRDGELILTDSRASSFFEADLTPGNTYTYGVAAGANGNTSSAAAITLALPIQ